MAVTRKDPGTYPPPAADTLPDEFVSVPATTRAKVQEALAKIVLSQGRTNSLKPPTLKAVRTMAQVDQRPCSALTRAWKLGRMPDIHVPGSWTPEIDQDPDASADAFAAQVRAARNGTDDERAALAHEITARVGTGQLTSGQGNTMLKGLEVATKQRKAQRDQDGPTEDIHWAPLTPLAFAVGRAIEGIVSENRRVQIAEFVMAEAEADRRENPNIGRDTE